MSGIIWWVIGTVGISGALLAVAIFTVGWPVIIGTKLGRILLAAGTAGVGLILLIFKERAAGAAAERRKQEQIDAAFKAKADADRDRIHNLPDDALDNSVRDGTAQP